MFRKGSANEIARRDIEDRVAESKKSQNEELAAYVINLDFPAPHATDDVIADLLNKGIDQGWSVAGTFIIPAESKEAAEPVYNEWLDRFGGYELLGDVPHQKLFEEGQLVDLVDYIRDPENIELS